MSRPSSRRSEDSSAQIRTRDSLCMQGNLAATPDQVRSTRASSRYGRIAVAVALTQAVLEGPAYSHSTPGAQLTVVAHSDRVEAASVAYIALRITNTGDRPLRGCDRPQEDEVVSDRCVTLGWRFWKAPAAPRPQNMDVIRGLPPNVTLQPGQSMQRLLRVETPSPHARGPLNLYLFVRDGAHVASQYTAIPITVTSALASRWPRILGVWALCGTFLATIGVVVGCAVRRWALRNRR